MLRHQIDLGFIKESINCKIIFHHQCLLCSNQLCALQWLLLLIQTHRLCLPTQAEGHLKINSTGPQIQWMLWLLTSKFSNNNNLSKLNNCIHWYNLLQSIILKCILTSRVCILIRQILVSNTLTLPSKLQPLMMLKFLVLIHQENHQLTRLMAPSPMWMRIVQPLQALNHNTVKKNMDKLICLDVHYLLWPNPIVQLVSIDNFWPATNIKQYQEEWSLTR